jgi:hypothetical protein
LEPVQGESHQGLLDFHVHFEFGDRFPPGKVVVRELFVNLESEGKSGAISRISSSQPLQSKSESSLNALDQTFMGTGQSAMGGNTPIPGAHLYDTAFRKKVYW